MKIWGLPKTQINTYLPSYQQNSSLNSNPIGKNNLAQDMFVSRVNFGTKIDVLDIIKKLPNLADIEKLRELTCNELRGLMNATDLNHFDTRVVDYEPEIQRQAGVLATLKGDKETKEGNAYMAFLIGKWESLNRRLNRDPLKEMGISGDSYPDWPQMI